MVKDLDYDESKRTLVDEMHRLTETDFDLLWSELGGHVGSWRTISFLFCNVFLLFIV